MKKHLLRVFLLVLLVISLSLSCVPDRKPLAPPAIQASTPSISTLVALAITPTPVIPTIYPSPTNTQNGLINEVNALNRLELYDIAIAEANLYPNYQLNAFAYANICLESALHKLAAEALPICDLAVQNYPNYEEMLYARGIARSLTGDYEGAISDFDIFLQEIDKDREKKYSSKYFGFNKNIYLFEDRIYGWIERLKSEQNPFTYSEMSTLPTFVITEISFGDYEYTLLEHELTALIKYKQYEAAMALLQNYYMSSFTPKLFIDGEWDPQDRQQLYTSISYGINLLGYRRVCVLGCFAGDFDQVYQYCEQFDKLYQSIPIIFSSEWEYLIEKDETISHGIYLVYLGDYDAAKTYFEEYLAWQQSMEDYHSPWRISDEDLEQWIDKLENNQFPFNQQTVYSLQTNIK